MGGGLAPQPAIQQFGGSGHVPGLMQGQFGCGQPQVFVGGAGMGAGSPQLAMGFNGQLIPGAGSAPASNACYACGDPGHYANRCPNRGARGPSSNSRPVGRDQGSFPPPPPEPRFSAAAASGAAADVVTISRQEYDSMRSQLSKLDSLVRQVQVLQAAADKVAAQKKAQRSKRKQRKADSADSQSVSSFSAQGEQRGRNGARALAAAQVAAAAAAAADSEDTEAPRAYAAVVASPPAAAARGRRQSAPAAVRAEPPAQVPEAVQAMPNGLVLLLQGIRAYSKEAVTGAMEDFIPVRGAHRKERLEQLYKAIFGAGVAVPGVRKDAIAAVTEFICDNWEHIAPKQR